LLELGSRGGGKKVRVVVFQAVAAMDLIGKRIEEACDCFSNRNIVRSALYARYKSCCLRCNTPTLHVFLSYTVASRRAFRQEMSAPSVFASWQELLWWKVVGRLRFFVVAWRESRGLVDLRPSHDAEDRLHDDSYGFGLSAESSAVVDCCILIIKMKRRSIDLLV
jgi:hypothetical protein